MQVGSSIKITAGKHKGKTGKITRRMPAMIEIEKCTGRVSICDCDPEKHD